MMARRVDSSHPRSVRVPISDLNAEIRRRRRQRRLEWLVRVGVFAICCVIAFGLVLLAGRGSVRR